MTECLESVRAGLGMKDDGMSGGRGGSVGSVLGVEGGGEEKAGINGVGEPPPSPSRSGAKGKGKVCLCHRVDVSVIVVS